MIKKQLDTEFCRMKVERVIGEFDRQSGFVLAEGKAIYSAVFPVEFITQSLIKRFKNTPLRLIITGARAKALGIKTSSKSVALDVCGLTAKAILALADPTAPSEKIKIHMPRQIRSDEHYSHLLSLVRRASLLPALVLAEGYSAPDMLSVSTAEVKLYLALPETTIIETAQAKLPLKNAENTRIISFRGSHNSSVHLALVVGRLSKNPLVRIHSACVTGDILGSLRCDCGDQLQMSLDKIIKEGCGILLYLNQEGRGIGIINKLRAYTLQEQGVDTFRANQMLGFDDDERDFSIASMMLKQLKIISIRLLTNNPQKIENLEKYGIKVTERLALNATPGKHNHAYINAKAKKTGHLY